MAVTVIGALLVTPVVGWLAENLVDERAAQAAEFEAVQERVRKDLAELGMVPSTAPAAKRVKSVGLELLRAGEPFSLALAGGVLAGKPPPEAQERRAAEIVAEELARYPSGFLAEHRLLRVVLVGDLTEAGLPIPSLPNLEQSLVLDVDGPEPFLRRLIHHEVYHFVDYAVDDQVKRDPAWQALNDRYFVYGSGGRFVRHGSASRFGSGGRGFVTEYARSGLEEDKAETYAFLLTAPAKMRRRMAADATLEKQGRALMASLERRDPRTRALFGERR